jgi:nucleotide-binding universal stress UspA family protein
VQLDYERDAVLARAVQLAKADQARLTVVDVLPDLRSPIPLVTSGEERVIQQLSRDKQQRLEEVGQSLRGQGLDVTTRLLDSPSSLSLIREVLAEGHDLVVRASKGKRSRRLGFFGTTARRLIRKCPCPVLLLKPGHESRSARIVAAIEAAKDDERHATLDRQIMEAATKFQSIDQGRLDIVHSWSVYGASILREHLREEEFRDLESRTKEYAQKQLDHFLKQYASGLGPREVHLLQGEPAEQIPRFVSQGKADLLVLGTVGRSGLTGLLVGNTAEQILDNVECSVLTLKPHGFVSPVHR